MPGNAREVRITIRAVDQATRVLNSIGQQAANLARQLNATQGTIRVQVQQSGQAVQQAGAAIVQAGQQAGQAGQQAHQSALKWGTLAAEFYLVRNAARLVANALEGILGFGQLGATLTQTTKSFDSMTRSVGVNAALLDQLRDAAHGTVSDLELMQSAQTALIGSSGRFGTELAHALPQLVQISRAANIANPSLGTTAFLFNSLTIGLKRLSPRLIDNTGLQLRLGESYAKLAIQLGKTTEELTSAEQQQALLSATLEAGARLIEQIGGQTTSATDAYQHLQATLKNVTVEIAQGYDPAIRDILVALTDLVTVTGNVDQGWRETLGTISTFTLLTLGAMGAVVGLTAALSALQAAMATFVVPLVAAAVAAGPLALAVGLLTGTLLLANRAAQAHKRETEEMVRGFEAEASKLDMTKMSYDEYVRRMRDAAATHGLVITASGALVREIEYQGLALQRVVDQQVLASREGQEELELLHIRQQAYQVLALRTSDYAEVLALIASGNLEAATATFNLQVAMQNLAAAEAAMASATAETLDEAVRGYLEAQKAVESAQKAVDGLTQSSVDYSVAIEASNAGHIKLALLLAKLAEAEAELTLATADYNAVLANGDSSQVNVARLAALRARDAFYEAAAAVDAFNAAQGKAINETRRQLQRSLSEQLEINRVWKELGIPIDKAWESTNRLLNKTKELGGAGGGVADAFREVKDEFQALLDLASGLTPEEALHKQQLAAFELADEYGRMNAAQAKVVELQQRLNDAIAAGEHPAWIQELAGTLFVAQGEVYRLQVGIDGLKRSLEAADDAAAQGKILALLQAMQDTGRLSAKQVSIVFDQIGGVLDKTRLPAADVLAMFEAFTEAVQGGQDPTQAMAVLAEALKAALTQTPANQFASDMDTAATATAGAGEAVGTLNGLLQTGPENMIDALDAAGQAVDGWGVTLTGQTAPGGALYNYQTAIQTVIDTLHSFPSQISTTVSVNTLGVPGQTPLAHGGAFPANSFLFNESPASRPETVVMADRPGWVLTKQQAQAGLGGGTTIGTLNINIPPGNTNPRETARAVMRELERRGLLAPTRLR